MKKVTWIIITLLALLISGYSATQYLILEAEQSGYILGKVAFGYTLDSTWYLFLYLHVIFSIFALILGPFLFSKNQRDKHLKRHRTLGKIYLIGILIGGLAGFYLSFFGTGGLATTLGFGFLSIFWLVTGFIAYQKARLKQLAKHREWMIRNFSLTLAAVTLRLWLALFIRLFGIENYLVSYSIISWLAWVSNLLIAELYVRRYRLVD